MITQAERWALIRTRAFWLYLPLPLGRGGTPADTREARGCGRGSARACPI